MDNVQIRVLLSTWIFIFDNASFYNLIKKVTDMPHIRELRAFNALAAYSKEDRQIWVDVDRILGSSTTGSCG
jgi:hypothetical protein